MSKPLDGLGVDVYFGEQLPPYIRKIYIQCKKTLTKGKGSMAVDILPLLEMKIKGINLLYTRVTKKLTTKKGLVSMKESVVAELVTMELETFEIFLDAYKRVQSTPSPEPESTTINQE